jgi:hypothetical protein
MDFNLHLFDEDEQASAAVATDGVCIDRSWCQPSRHVDVVGVDFGKQGMCAYSLGSGRAFSVPCGSEIRWLLSLPAKTLVVCEWAHLAVPQTEKSLAQFFTAAELLSLYDGLRLRCITLRLFPHYHSGPRARVWAAARFPETVSADKSDDTNDAKALALYVSHCNGVSLAAPPQTFGRCARRDYGRQVIDSANRVLNAERVRGYKGLKFPKVVALGRRIHRKCFSAFIDHDRAVAIAALIVTEIGGDAFMFTRNGRIPGARFWMRYVLRFTPFHHRGGIARSNLMKHRFPAFLAKHAKSSGIKEGKKRIPFGLFSDSQDSARRLALKSMRKGVLEAYRIGIKEAEKMGLERYDISDKKQSAKQRTGEQ